MGDLLRKGTASSPARRVLPEHSGLLVQAQWPFAWAAGCPQKKMPYLENRVYICVQMGWYPWVYITDVQHF